jgi:Ser/Thr protein kinase RdoA (MazF antagonist)
MDAAGHLVHGLGNALEPPAWPAITLAEADAVLRLFPAAGRPVAVAWHSPRPFSAAALITTRKAAVFLKRHHRSVRSPGALAQEHAFMAHLRSNGLAVPDIVAAHDGTCALARGDWTYELHHRAPGLDLYRDRPSWTPFLSHRHAHAAGVALGRLHRAARDFDAPARGPDPLIGSFTIVPAPDPLAAAEAYVAARPALARFLAGVPWRHDLAHRFATLGQGLSDRLARLPALWTHNDWHPSNLLWSADDTVCTVFDFGLATRTCALHDLATAIERTAVPWLDLAAGRGDARADPQAAVALLTGYATVMPLTAEDLATLVRLLPLVHVEFALSEVDYFAGIRADRVAAQVAWQGYCLGHADWFGSAPGQTFCDALQRGAGA